MSDQKVKQHVRLKVSSSMSGYNGLIICIIKRIRQHVRLKSFFLAACQFEMVKQDVRLKGSISVSVLKGQAGCQIKRIYQCVSFKWSSRMSDKRDLSVCQF